MASVNHVIVLGNLGRDPEVKQLADGTAICNLSIATTYAWKDKTSGEKKEETEWHRVTLRARLAEVAGEYLRKGSSVYVGGRLRTRKWTDKQGVERYSTEIVGETMQLLGGKGGERAAPEPAPVAKPAANPGGAAFDGFPDDIPF